MKSGNIKIYLSKFKQCVVFLYLFCMLGLFPLYHKDKYYQIGDAKFEFFWKVSLGFLGIFTVFALIRIIMQTLTRGIDDTATMGEKTKNNQQQETNPLLRFLDNLSALDYGVFIYGICVILSYAFSDYKEFALKGAAGWNMGLCSQMIFVALYFVLSRQREFFQKLQDFKEKNEYQDLVKVILSVHLGASAMAFLLGILHRFEIDPLGMYVGLDLYQKLEFLSTFGQATWFSGYVCTVFSVGVALFYVSQQKWLRMLTGIYSVISFGILVTQNSDSAFMAIAGIMLLLGYFSLSDIKKWCRFWQVMSLMWGTFAGIGILQKIFADRVIPLDSLSVFFSQSAFTKAAFIGSLLLLLFYSNSYRKIIQKNQRINTKKTIDIIDSFEAQERAEEADKLMLNTKRIYKGILFLVAAGVFFTIIFIYLNTKGYLLQWFGYQNNNSYLLFDNHWGSNRGSTWMICWQAFLEMPFYQKLFGVGPDSLSAYLYSIPEKSDLLYSLWGNLRLTNAHNEFLNSLLCYGIVGLAAWLAVLIRGIRYFYKKAKENPFMIAFSLCIMGYACHNIFCYQQVCVTPFLFIAFGIGEAIFQSHVNHLLIDVGKTCK